jgi:hypothetical protein
MQRDVERRQQQKQEEKENQLMQQSLAEADKIDRWDYRKLYSN